jgi:hypothetical protein
VGEAGHLAVQGDHPVADGYLDDAGGLPGCWSDGFHPSLVPYPDGEACKGRFLEEGVADVVANRPSPHDAFHLAAQRQDAFIEGHVDGIAMQIDAGFALEHRAYILEDLFLPRDGDAFLASQRCGLAVMGSLRTGPTCSGWDVT